MNSNSSNPNSNSKNPNHSLTSISFTHHPHPHPHPHPLSSSSTTTTTTTTTPISHSQKRIKLPGDEEEIVAKKKKNADAQAAFRLRRQTYIKSLEDTVSQLKNGVSEMQVLLKSATHDVKLQRERVAFLESKLKQSQSSSNLSPSDSNHNPSSPPTHCSCCRYAPSLDIDQPQHPSSLLPSSTSSSSLLNPTSPTVPSPVSTPVLTPQSLHHQRNWSTHPRPSYPSVLLPQSHPPPPNSPPPPPPQQQQHQQQQQPSYNRLLPRLPSADQHESTPNSSYGAIFFDHFTTSSSTTTPFYQPSLDIHHHHQHPSSSSLESPRSATYLGIHQPASRAWPTYPPDHQQHHHPPHHQQQQQQQHTYKLDEPSRYYTDDHLQQKRSKRDEDGVAKLNGLPAKVARCNQAIMEVSKVVEQLS